MEVHAHTHTPRKKWTHYFWEFLMLFLAVTLGFFVENQREHLIEHRREKVFMSSMVNDLESDTAKFRSMIITYSNVANHIDSLIFLLSDFNNLEENAAAIYYHQVFLHDYNKLVYSDRTIQQLKNGGNFRLIRKNIISNNIISYDGLVLNQVESMQEKLVLTRHLKLNDGSSTIFKFGPLLKRHEKFTQTDTATLPEPHYFILPTRERVEYVINDLQLYSLSLMWFISSIEKAYAKANQLSALIKKEYHLK
ncbi:MAG TPA: hypothetical protein VFH08_14440 [Chitinophagaceae bacterium]|nr:hypothetical protein [Chitinophagaceae bacterium]